jgi:hypothetical protein
MSMRMLRNNHEKNQLFSDHGCRIRLEQHLQLQVAVTAWSYQVAIHSQS